MERGMGQHRMHPGKAEQGEENVQAANLAEFLNFEPVSRE